ncbi:hypothetical protein [Hymenobacter sp. CRA2]|uniref:hypothetical protein n=1 Tax=Hymenobacter sp. CRA2 TaxID=1955620 RepID=UPI00098F5D3D|nr:hypothetical protein [Hymenobacter sp. CRA2]OON70105.1 hypothetical protein B0919_05025 [Hymenobacter sp. CRA2]
MAISCSYSTPASSSAIVVDLLVAKARAISFSHDRTGIMHVYRRANSNPWARIAVNAASPFVDEDAFAPGTLVEYRVEQHSVQGHCLWSSAVAGTQV